MVWPTADLLAHLKNLSQTFFQRQIPYKVKQVKKLSNPSSENSFQNGIRSVWSSRFWNFDCRYLSFGNSLVVLVRIFGISVLF